MSAARSVPAGDFLRAFSPPVAVSTSTVCYLVRALDGSWNLVSHNVASPAQESSVPLNLDAAYENPKLFLDSGNRLWLVGENGGRGAGTIRIGRLENGGLTESRIVGLSAGLNDRADLCFFGPSRPWIAWIHHGDSNEEILAEDASAGHVWRITPAGTSALSSPRIRTDREGGIWVLWTGKVQNRYVVSGRRFDGRFWSEDVLIADNGDRPCLQLDAGSSPDGILRIAWSAYNGRQYKINTAVCLGGAWTQTRTLTDRDEMETAPRIVRFGEGSEGVVWAGLMASEKRLLAASLDDRTPAAPVVLSDRIDSPAYEAVGTPGGLFFLQNDREGLRSELLRGNPRQILSGSPAAHEVPSEGHRIGPSALTISTRLETQYIGFGDSITFGYINREEAPDRGYIPRLDIKLDAAFGPTTVINAGFPGEYTIEGLARIDSILAVYPGRYVLLMEGTNDVKHVETPIETSLYNLQEICKRCLAAGALPLLATVIPRRDDIWEFEYYQGRHYQLEAGIRALAQALVIPLVEMETAFDNYPGGPDNLLSDYVHPNEIGYVLMTETWYQSIRALPFAPVNLEIRTKARTSPAAVADGSGADRASSAAVSANLISWEANPKTADIAVIKGYKIYRKKSGESLSQFVLIGRVEGVYAYLDRALNATYSFEYMIVTVTKDNVEGAGSEIVRR